MQLTDEQLTISTLIQLLSRLQAEHGDVPVIVCDADTKWDIQVSGDNIYVDQGRLVIAVDYQDERENHRD